MEKKYLELYNRGRLIGAFEDVTKFEESEDGNTISVESADGNYTLTRDSVYGEYKLNTGKCYLYFDSYNYCCRRTIRNHTNNLKDAQKGSLK